ncbi:MAG: Oligopeptide-binding protein AppA [Syntrophomonadaceae bacterium]|nr:Oligopeptide-binding protein AppA [Bacillota bacterium]
MRKEIALAVLLLGLAALSAAGCGGVRNRAERAERPANELVVAIGGEPEAGFDPTTGWGAYGSPLFQSTLLARDHNLTLVNDLAAGHEISTDGLTWTVRLRNDVKFSDDRPLTAEDVAYTFSAAARSGAVIDLNNMKSVAAVDGQTVKFRLNQPQSTFVNLLARIGIVPRHAHGPDYAVRPLGSGPFKFVQWDRGQQLIVEANPLYHGQQPYFQRITFLFMSDDAALAAAKAGQADLIAVPEAFARQEIAGMRLLALDSVDNRGIMFPFVAAGGRTKDGHPVGNDVTADLAIRRAINIAIDRQALADGVLGGFGSPAYSSSDGLPWWNPETVIQDANIDLARQILADAGWKESGNDGLLEKGDLQAQFTLVYPAADLTRKGLSLAVADQLRPLGIKIDVAGKSWEVIQAMMHANAVLFGWGSHDPLEMYNLYSSETRGIGWFNAGFYSNSVVDGYMAKALAATSEEEANRYWQKAQWDGQTGLSARGDAPWAWLVNLDHLYFVSEGLDLGRQRIQPHGHGWPVTANITEWRRKE